MDAKLTLSLDKEIIHQAKKIAEKNGLSLSRLTELLYRKLNENSSTYIDDLPISDWVYKLAEGKAEYKKSEISRKNLRDEYFSSRK